MSKNYTINEDAKKKQAVWLDWVRKEQIDVNQFDVNQFTKGFMRDIAKSIVENKDLSFWQIFKFSKSSGLWRQWLEATGQIKEKKQTKKIIKKKPVIVEKSNNNHIISENDIIKKLKSMKKEELINLIIKGSK
jgi:hypothetical protein